MVKLYLLNLQTLKTQIKDYIENSNKTLSTEIENLIFPLLNDKQDNKIVALNKLLKNLEKIKI